MLGVLLLSEGIDSPVAGYMMHRQGMEIIALHFINSKSPKARDKVKRLAKLIHARVVEVDHIKTQEKIRNTCSSRFQCIMCKRAMYRSAEKVANDNGADYLITGESLGQVASQTLENMSVLDQAVDMTVLRPLLGLDKQEIITIAKEIGTYNISIEASPPCAYAPPNPATKAKLDVIQKLEKWNTSATT